MSKCCSDNPANFWLVNLLRQQHKDLYDLQMHDKTALQYQVYLEISTALEIAEKSISKSLESTEECVKQRPCRYSTLSQLI